MAFDSYDSSYFFRNLQVPEGLSGKVQLMNLQDLKSSLSNAYLVNRKNIKRAQEVERNWLVACSSEPNKRFARFQRKEMTTRS